MTQSLMINIRNGNNLVFEMNPIDELYLDDRILGGLCLFFDKDNELIKFCCSYNDVINIAMDGIDEYVDKYYLIVDEEQPFTKKEIDVIYNNFINEQIFIFNLDEWKIPIELCLN
jgi:hypothetical protein